MQIQQRQESHEQNLSSLQNRLQSIEKALNQYFTDPKWTVSCQQNSQAFITQVQAFASQWQESANKRELADKKSNELGQVINLLKNGVEGIETSLKALQQSFQEASSQLEELKEERVKLLGGKPVKAFQEEWQQKLERWTALSEKAYLDTRR